MGETTNKTKLARCFSLFELGNVYIRRGINMFISTLIYKFGFFHKKILENLRSKKWVGTCQFSCTYWITKGNIFGT